MIMARRRQLADAVLHCSFLCRECGTGESLCCGKRRWVHVVRWVGRTEASALEASAGRRMAVKCSSMRRDV